MFNEEMAHNRHMLRHVPDYFRTQEMCIKAVDEKPCALECVPDQYITQEMCNKSVRRELYVLDYVPDHLKILEMCNDAVWENPLSLVRLMIGL